MVRSAQLQQIVKSSAEITSVKPDLDSASEGKHYDNMQH